MSPLSTCQLWFRTSLATLGQMSLRRQGLTQNLPCTKLQTSAKSTSGVFPPYGGDGCILFLLTEKAKHPLS